MFQKSIHMTSKGTFTLPAKIRADLGLEKTGDKLMVTYHPESKRVELSAAPNFAAIRAAMEPYALTNEPLDLAKLRKQHHAQRAQRIFE